MDTDHELERQTERYRKLDRNMGRKSDTERMEARERERLCE